MSLDILNNKGSSNLSGSKLLTENDTQNDFFKENFFTSKTTSFDEISAFKNSPFGQYWNKFLPSWAVADYGPARILNESNFSIIDLSQKFSNAKATFYNDSIGENWDEIKFKVYANPNGQDILKQYANVDFKPNDDEVLFLIETDDGKFDFGKIVRVKLGKKAIEKLQFQFPFLGQTNEEDLAEEFLKRPFEIKNNSSLDFVEAGKEVKLDPKELKDLLAKAIKYDFQQKKFDDMSLFLVFLQGSEYLGLNIPKKILEFSHWMRSKKYDEEKYWNALLNKGFTPAFLPNVIVPQNKEEIKESIKNKFKKQIDDVSKFNQNDATIEKIFKEILNNLLLYLFEKFSSLLDEGLKKFDEFLPEGEILNEIYNLNAFLVGLWNGCLEFVAGLIDLVSLVMMIARDGVGFTLTDALGEAFENLLNDLVFNFENFIKKLWAKLITALKEFPDWYLKYGTNQYYWYKKLGELTPDILTFLVPALKAGRAAKAAEQASVLKKAATTAEKDLEYQKYLDGYYESLRKQSDDFSKKLEEQSARQEAKEAFDNAEKELDEIIKVENKTNPSKGEMPNAKPKGRITKIPDNLDDATKTSLILENEAAEILSKKGFDIEQNPSISTTLKNPDYIIEGKIFDCYSPYNSNKAVRGIWTEIADKVKKDQTNRIVLNLKNWNGDLLKLQKQFLDWEIDGLKEVIYITKQGDINYLKLKK